MTNPRRKSTKCKNLHFCKNHQKCSGVSQSETVVFSDHLDLHTFKNKFSKTTSLKNTIKYRDFGHFWSRVGGKKQRIVPRFLNKNWELKFLLEGSQGCYLIQNQKIISYLAQRGSRKTSILVKKSQNLPRVPTKMGSWIRAINSNVVRL